MSTSGITKAEDIGAVARDTGKIERTAREFEALIIAEMLKSARQGASLSSVDGESGSDDAISGFAEQQLSQVLSSAGGLGLASLVVQGLEARHTAK